MNLTEFKALKSEQRRTVIQNIVPGKFGDRVVIRDTTADPFDLECLDALTCPVCAGDLVRTNSPSGADRVFYYKCVDKPDLHQYLRVMPPHEDARPRSIQKVASDHLSRQLLIGPHLDGMGRPID